MNCVTSFYLRKYEYLLVAVIVIWISLLSRLNKTSGLKENAIDASLFSDN